MIWQQRLYRAAYQEEPGAAEPLHRWNSLSTGGSSSGGLQWMKIGPRCMVEGVKSGLTAGYIFHQWQLQDLLGGMNIKFAMCTSNRTRTQRSDHRCDGA
jgi:hypothetical protein